MYLSIGRNKWGRLEGEVWGRVKRVCVQLMSEELTVGTITDYVCPSRALPQGCIVIAATERYVSPNGREARYGNFKTDNGGYEVQMRSFALGAEGRLQEVFDVDGLEFVFPTFWGHAGPRRLSGKLLREEVEEEVEEED